MYPSNLRNFEMSRLSTSAAFLSPLKFPSHPNQYSLQTPRCSTQTSVARARHSRVLPPPIQDAQRLRKSGDWSSALSLLSSSPPSLHSQTLYLNELILISIARLRAINPFLSVQEVRAALNHVLKKSSAPCDSRTLNAILTGIKAVAKGDKVELEAANDIMENLVGRGVRPDHFTMSILFQMCAASRNLEFTEMFRQRANELIGRGATFRPNVQSGTSLMNAYVKCDQGNKAEEVFDEMKRRGVVLNEFSYCVLISYYYHCGQHEKVLEAFKEAVNCSAVQINQHLLSGVLASCTRAKDNKSARWVYDLMVKSGVKGEESMKQGLLQTAIKAGDLAMGRDVLFNWMTDREVTPAMCGKLIAAGKRSRPDETERLVKELRALIDTMKEHRVEITTSVLNSLVSTYVKFGLLNEARMVLHEFAEHGLKPDVVTYNTLLHGLGVGKKPELAMKVIEIMKRQGVRPNEATYHVLMDLLLEHKNLDMAAVISDDWKMGKDGEGDTSASARFKLFRASKDVKGMLNLYRECIEKNIDLDEVTYGTILWTLLKCGEEHEALGIIGRLFVKGEMTSGLANTILEYWSRKDDGWTQCIQMLDKMKGVGLVPDEITYGCVMVGFCSAGKLNRAFRLISEIQDVGLVMQKLHVWCALINACGQHGQWERGVELLRSMERSGPRPGVECYNAGLYAAGMGGGWKGLLVVWDMMKERKVWDAVSMGALGSGILKNRLVIQDWDVVREVYDEMGKWTGKGGGRRLEKKRERVKWLLDMVEEGKIVEQDEWNESVGHDKDQKQIKR